ncbi:hypothetical protein F5Y14DRAFT_54180 [Nemania sp. NC0429]|nr:hypothetical protein F5Y14DRAFT_54180 [Nemania sp. NC0429]
MVSVRSTIEIARSPAHVYKVFTDFPKYHEWVQGSIKGVEILTADGSISVGDKIKIAFPGMGSFSGEVAANSPPTEFKWRNKWPGLLLAEHSFRFEPSQTTPGHTTFVNSEEFSGALTYLTYLTGSKHQGESSPGFEMFNKSLKARAESLPEL